MAEIIKTSPKEKALELIESFSDCAYNHPLDTEREVLESKKECALVCVNEILIALKVDDWGDMYKYYLEVKQEIEKI